MILASYNVENLFERPRVMNQETGGSADRWEEGRRILNEFAALNALITQPLYSTQDKQKIIELLKSLGLEKSDSNKFIILRQNRGRLIKRPRGKPIEIVASGRYDWIGWVELTQGHVQETAMMNTGRVIDDIQADVLAVIEADNRIALSRFSEYVLTSVGTSPYEHVMVIDGNDERGIDVGIMTRAGYSILSVCSHVDDLDVVAPADGAVALGGPSKIFGRDCPEYLIETPSKQRLWVLVNHFKSKGYGTQASSNARRKKQANRVREIYEALLDKGETFIAVVGDMNDTPDSDPLSPLLGNGSTLKDISAHPQFDDMGRPGTYANCTKSNKIDYLLLSPELFARVRKGGIFRKGVWGGKNGTLWEIYPEMKKEADAASDHAAIWAEIDL